MKILLFLMLVTSVLGAKKKRCITPKEVIVLLDQSGDMDDAELISIRKFTNSMATDFHVSPHGSHFAMVLAGDTVTTHVRFIIDGLTKRALKKKLKLLKTTSAQAWSLPEALDAIKNNLVATKARRFLPIIVVVFARGGNPSGDYSALVDAARSLRREKVELYVVNVNGKAPEQLIQSLVSNQENVFKFATSEMLVDNVHSFTSQICSTHKDSMRICNVPVDIGFIVDSSGSITNAGYRNMKNFMMGVSLSMGFQANKTHVGMVLYSDHGELAFAFRDFGHIRKLFRAIRNLPHRKMRTRIDLGLKVAATQLFTKDGGMRDHVTKIAILMTDGEQTTENVENLIPLSEAADEFRKRGITIFAVGVGKNVKRDQLLEVAGNEDQIIFANTFSDLEQGVQKIAELTCKEVADAVINFTKPVYTFKEHEKAVVGVHVVGGKITRPTTVVVSTHADSAKKDDFVSINIPVVFQPGETAPKMIEIPLVDDELIEGTETIDLTLNTTDPVLLGPPAYVAILDNDALSVCDTEKVDCGEFATCVDTGIGQYTCACDEGYFGDGKECEGVLVGFTSGNYTYGEEEQGKIALVVKSGVVTTDVNILVKSVPLSATEKDYSPVSKTVTFRRGESGPKTVDLEFNDDIIVEYPEDFSVELSTSSSGAAVEGPAYVTILDNDDATIGFTQESYDVKEDEVPVVQLAVTLGEIDIPVTVKVTTVPATATNDDFIPKISNVTFQPGEKGPKSIKLEVVDDPEVEETEHFDFSIVSSSSPRVKFGNPASINIHDNDGAVVQFTKPIYSYKEDEKTDVAIELTSGKLDTPVTISVKATPSSATADDFTQVTKDVTFNPGETGPKQVDIELVDDDIGELTEKLNVEFVSSSINRVQLGEPSEVEILDNDDAVVSFTKPLYNAIEGGESDIAVELNRKNDFPVTVTISAIPGSAEQDDYSPKTQNITFNPGETGPKPVDISPVDDKVVEQTEQFNVALKSTSPRVKVGEPSSVNIRDNDVASVSFTKPNYETEEGKPSGVAVQLDKEVDFPVKIKVSTAVGTAQLDDYTPESQEITFNPGETGPKPVDINPVVDDLVEPEEKFDVLFESSSSPSVMLGEPSSVTIKDDDEVVASFSKPVYDSKEGQPSGVAVQLNKKVDFPVTVKVASDAGTAKRNDFTQESQEVTFNPGETGPKLVNINAVEDDVVEPEEQFNVFLESSSSPRVKLGEPASVKIKDNDMAAVSFTKPNYETQEGKPSGVAVQLDKEVDFPVKIKVSTAVGTAKLEDYTPESQEITFNPGETGPKPVDINPVVDDLVEPEEKFDVLFESSSSPSVMLGEPSSVTIKDDDEVIASFTKPVYDSKEGQPSGVAVQLNKKVDFPVTVKVASDAGTAKRNDFTPESQEVTFNPGETGPKLVNINAVDDDVVEPEEQFKVFLESSSSPRVKLGEPASVEIKDNDKAVVRFTKPVYESEEGKRSGVSLQLDKEVDFPVEIKVSTQTGTAKDDDFIPKSRRVTFNPGETGPKPVYINPVEDDVVEPDEQFDVLFDSSSSPRVELGEPASVTIKDNDAAVVSFTKPTYNSKEGKPSGVAIQLDKKVDYPVKIKVSTKVGTANQDDFHPATQEVTFNPGETGPKSIEVKPVEDDIVEPEEQFNVLFKSSSSPSVKLGEPASVTIKDNDEGTTFSHNCRPYNVLATSLQHDSDVVVSFTKPAYESSEGQSPGVAIQLNKKVDFPVTVNISTNAGSAGEDDFTPKTQEVTFNPGETGPKQIDIKPVDDDVVEPKEHFDVSFQSSSSPSVKLGEPASVTINDNDEALVSFSKPVYHAKENGSAVVEIRLEAGKLATPVKVRVSGGPNNGKMREVMFEPGQNSSKKLVYDWEDDNVLEPTESFQISLSTNFPAVNVGDPSAIEIFDDDNVYIDFTKRVYDVYEDETAVIGVKIKSGAVGTPLRIRVSTKPQSAGSGDFKPMVQDVVFDIGETNPKFLPINIIDDKLIEPTENFTVILSSDYPTVDVGKPAVINIFDNDGKDSCSFDIGFLVDSSGSMRGCNYDNEKTFIKNIAKNVSANSRASVIVYAKKADVERKFDFADGMNGFHEQVESLPYHGGKADLGNAIDLAASSMFSSENGMRDFNTPKVLIVLNDGSDQSSITKSKRDAVLSKLEENIVQVIVVGVGEADMNSLAKYVNKPEHLILVDRFVDAEPRVAALLKKICHKDDNCIVNQKPVNIEIGGCVSRKPLNIRSCLGDCSSAEQATLRKVTNTNGAETYEFQCRCCVPRAKTHKDVTLECGMNITKVFQIAEPTSCGCSAC